MQDGDRQPPAGSGAPGGPAGAAAVGGSVVVAVASGRYCRPGCPAREGSERLTLPSAAAAQAAGYLECTACPVDAVPGAAGWSSRTDLVARAVRAVEDGEVERTGVRGLAVRLGASPGDVEAALAAELGAGALALARANRVRTARLLLEATGLPGADVARAAGFRGARDMGAALWSVTGLSAAQVRHAAGRRAAGTRAAGSRAGDPAAAARAPGALTLRLPFRAPLLPDSLLGHLVATGVPGVEEWRAGAYRRTVRLPHGPGVVALTPHADHVACRLHLRDLRDLAPALHRCRRLLDLDADPAVVDGALSRDPALAVVVAAAPGRRVPRTVDGPELAVRAVLGQQVSTAAARTHAGRLVRAHGEEVEDPEGGLTHLFPDVAALADVDPATLALPRARQRAMGALLAALGAGVLDLDPEADPLRAREELARLPGFGPWTVETIAMRALGDPDAFLPADLGVALAAARLGLPATPGALRRHSERWRPWRSYAVQYLWATGDHAVNRLPAGPP